MTDSPTDVTAPLHLPDGTGAWVWTLQQQDRGNLVAEFEKLSPETRRLRFLSPVSHLSDAMLAHLVDEVDGVNHVALVLVCADGDEFEPVAIARMVRYPEDRSAADLAVTVKDAWHGRGVATVLLSALMQRRPAGVTHIITEVAADNPASLAMLRRLGPTTTSDSSPGVLSVRVQLDGTEPVEPPEQVPHRPERQRLRTRDRICPWLQPGA